MATNSIPSQQGQGQGPLTPSPNFASGISISGGGGAGATGYSFVNGVNSQVTNFRNTVEITGQGADLVIDKKSMKQWMEAVEKRLAILQPKPELLEKYEALKQAFDHYKTLENLLYGTEDDNTAK